MRLGNNAVCPSCENDHFVPLYDNIWQCAACDRQYLLPRIRRLGQGDSRQQKGKLQHGKCKPKTLEEESIVND